METENQQVVPKRGFLTKKRLLTLLLIALLASGAWWFISPRALYQVATIKASLVAFEAVAPVIINEAGFLLNERDGTLGLYDGRTGRRRWSIKAHADPGHQYLNAGVTSVQCRCALTRGGHYFALIAPWHNRFHVQSWHDGKLTGDLLLPLGKCGDASGTIGSFDLSETGRLTLTIIAEKARVALPQQVNVVVENGRFSAHYSAGKQNNQSNSEWSAKEVEPHHKFQVFHPTSGKAWTFTTPFVDKKQPGGWDRCTVSSSGEYAVVARYAHRVYRPFWDSLVSLCPSLGALNSTGPCIYYYVYARPGRMCAMMNEVNFAPDPFLPQAYISADGHSVLIGPLPDNMRQPLYKLYRW